MRQRMFLLGFLLLVACHQPTAGELAKALETGDSGYTGDVVPFSKPYLISYNATPILPFTAVLVFSSHTGTDVRQDISGTVKVDESGGGRILRMAVTSIVQNGQSVRSAGPPLALLRSTMSPLGEVEATDIDFPFYKEQGAKNLPGKDSPLYKQLETASRSLQWIPKGPVSDGETLFTADVILKRFLHALEDQYGQMHPEVKSNTLRARVLGKTTRRDKDCIVVGLSGSVELFESGATLVTGAKGYSLLDPQTGLSVEGQFAGYIIGKDAQREREGRVDTFAKWRLGN